MSSYAVIKTGGKQYRVAPGGSFRFEKLPGEVGQDIEFGEVLMANRDGEVILDASALGDFKVTGRIVRHGRGTKIHILKFKRRKGFQRRQGHRQDFTEVMIRSVGSDTMPAAPAKAKPEATEGEE